MLKKEWKIIKLDNGEKKLTVTFHDKEYELLSTLLFVEVNSFGEWIKENICDILQGKAERRDISGNVCELIIEKETTAVYDMLAEDGVGNRCSIPTRELLDLINEWQKRVCALNNTH